MMLQNLTNMTSVREFHSAENVLLLFLYTFILVVGFIGNSLVVCFFGFKTKYRKLFHHYLLHLAFADMIASVVTSTHYLYNTATMNKWILGTELCKTLSSLGPVTVNVSAWIITSIAIERHRGINKPFQKRLGKYSIHFIMICIWTLSFLLLIPYIKSMVVHYGQCMPVWKNEVYEFVYSIVTLTIQSIIPFCMMLTIFAGIKKTVKNGKTLSVHYKVPLFKKQNESKLARNLSTKSCIAKQNRDKKLLQMLSAAFVVFILCSLPYNLFYTISIYVVRIQQKKVDMKILFKANVWLSSIVVMNSCMNFFIYAGLDKNFMNYCKSFLLRKQENRERIDTGTSRLTDEHTRY
ncbi:neuropeptide Y receptor type 6-like [Hydractinia symbiolongicarpus]|uniref:neuropeptide Y receptor type 6-like n=1 Tax=Hydractinia symbiolongicarpus TaxID=13093 RepID=UPI00254BD0ED|nr:neuropeptide Y receptor type 6-like [Hydractinia symbiolongicarpus]